MKNSIGHPMLGMQLSKNIWETEFLFRKKILWGARLLLLPSFTIIKTFRYSVWTRYEPKWVNLNVSIYMYYIGSKNINLFSFLKRLIFWTEVVFFEKIII
jgi:hypothetical protein